MNTLKNSIVLIVILLIGCKKPFSQKPETALALPTTETSIVFIAGFDEGSNTYYTNAKNYFKAQKMQVITNLFSIDEIIDWLNLHTNKNTNYKEIHIVSHSNAWLGMALKTTKNGNRITTKTLASSLLKNKISTLNNGLGNNTKIIFHSCGLGENLTLLQTLKQTFTNHKTPKIYASSLFNIFGGKYAGHYLAKPYYGFYPTAESPGPAQLSKEFKKAYPNKNIDWFTAIKTRHETSLGKVYSYKFNVPIEWEFTFNNTTEIPQLKNKDAIMDWVSESPEMAEALYNLNIPIEKYRWKSTVKGNKLIIKGKTTVLCVLEPVLETNDANEYRVTALEDDSLYRVL